MEVKYGLEVVGGPENTIYLDIPPQKPLIEVSTKIQKNPTTQAVVTIIQILANLSLSYSLNQLWSMINTQ
jgi:hypothetical protein